MKHYSIFFETLACYTRRKHLDFTLVSNGFSLPIRCYGFTLKNDIVNLRRELQDAQRYAHLEWLNHALEKELEQRHGKQCILTKEQVSYFLQSETSTRVPNASNLESTHTP